MERYEVPEDRQASLADLVDRAERGDEVVILRAGKVVAELRPTRALRQEETAVDLEQLAAIHALLGPATGVSGADIVRRMRDMDER